MKQNEKLMAEQLFYQTGLTKTQIADCLGINRRTLTTWASDNNWDRIRTSARHMPSLIAENVYIAMAHFTNSIVSEDRINKPITETESKILHRLVLDVNKIKNRATLNENLEMLRYFMEFVQAKDPNAVDTIQPFVNDYIKSRAKVQPGQFMPSGFNEYGFMSKTQQNQEELRKDNREPKSREGFPDQYQSETEIPLTECLDIVLNTGHAPIITGKEENINDQANEEYAPDSSESPNLTEDEERESEENDKRGSEEITIKEFINTTYQGLKQQNLNRAARRKLEQAEEKKKDKKITHLDRNNFIHNSSCYQMGQKEMRRMDDETKYYRKKGMVDREYAKRKGELKETNLFADELIKALDKDYQATMIELKKRYNQ